MYICYSRRISLKHTDVLRLQATCISSVDPDLPTPNGLDSHGSVPSELCSQPTGHCYEIFHDTYSFLFVSLVRIKVQGKIDKLIEAKPYKFEARKNMQLHVPFSLMNPDLQPLLNSGNCRQIFYFSTNVRS